MAIARSSSKVESRNPLADWVVAAIRFIQSRRQILLGALVVLALIGAGWAALSWHRAQREAAGQKALSQAILALRPDASGAAPKTDEAVKLLQEIAAKYPGSEAAEEALIRLGNQQWDAGKTDAAADAFDRYLRDYRGGRFTMMAVIGRAYTLEAKGELENAAKTLSEGLNRNKDSALAGEAYTALARLYEEQKKPDEALKVYNQIAEKYPQSSWAQTATYRLSLLKSK